MTRVLPKLPKWILKDPLTQNYLIEMNRLIFRIHMVWYMKHAWWAKWHANGTGRPTIVMIECIEMIQIWIKRKTGALFCKSMILIPKIIIKRSTKNRSIDFSINKSISQLNDLSVNKSNTQSIDRSMTKLFDDRVPMIRSRSTDTEAAANTMETVTHASCIPPINLLGAYSISAWLAPPTVSPTASISFITVQLHWLAIGGKARCALATVGAARIIGQEAGTAAAACKATEADETLIRHCMTDQHLADHWIV